MEEEEEQQREIGNKKKWKFHYVCHGKQTAPLLGHGKIK